MHSCAVCVHTCRHACISKCMHVYQTCQNARLCTFTCTCDLNQSLHSAQPYPRVAGPPGSAASGHVAHTWHRIGSSNSIARSSDEYVCACGGHTSVRVCICARAHVHAYTRDTGMRAAGRAGVRSGTWASGRAYLCLPDFLDLCGRGVLQKIARRRVMQGQH